MAMAIVSGLELQVKKKKRERKQEGDDDDDDKIEKKKKEPKYFSRFLSSHGQKSDCEEVLARPPTLFTSSHLCRCFSDICLFIRLFYRRPAAAVPLSRCLGNWQTFDDFIEKICFLLFVLCSA